MPKDLKYVFSDSEYYFIIYTLILFVYCGKMGLITLIAGEKLWIWKETLHLKLLTRP